MKCPQELFGQCTYLKARIFGRGLVKTRAFVLALPPDDGTLRHSTRLPVVVCRLSGKANDGWISRLMITCFVTGRPSVGGIEK